MNFDKNTVFGFSLLAVLFFGYFYYNNIGQHEVEVQRKKIADSLARIEAFKDSTQSKQINSKQTLASPTINNKNKVFIIKNTIAEEFTNLETEKYKITFSNKGAVPIAYTLKTIPSLHQAQTSLISNGSFEINYEIKGIGTDVKEAVKNIFFNAPIITKNVDGSQQIEFIYQYKINSFLKHIYTLHSNGYLFDFTIFTNDRGAIFNDKKVKISWLTKLQQHEKNLDYEKTQAQFSILTTKKNFDYFTIGNGSNETFEEPLKWVSIKQQFFNNTLISKDKLTDVKNESSIIVDTINRYFLSNITNFNVEFADDNQVKFQLYYGPTDYDQLKKYDLELERIMNIGQGFYAFVKYINKGLVMPVFNFLKNHIVNFGIVILLLTIFLRIITAPLLYTSYTSAAKMKILKPELDTLKKKMGDDQQGYAMKQMELYRNAGVNPLGGCIPALLQIPIFLSLFYFFNSCIDLRGHGFLWADDLSSFDSIYNFGFSVPFYGDHISLFTILNVITSFFISYLGMKNTPDQGNPMLKYMPYIFPFILLGFFNSLPSSLTWYYTVSNTITLLLQFVIQNYIINHDTLLKQMEAKRNAPKKKSSWMQKVEDMQNTQKKMKELKNK